MQWGVMVGGFRAVSALRRFLRDRSGAVAVEFAIVGSVLLLLVFGVFEFGRAIYYRNLVEVLTDEAARSSILSADCVPTQDALSDIRDFEFGLVGDAFTIVPASGANDFVMSVSYSFDLIVPIYGDSLITMTANRDLSMFCATP
jgi:Flp pilus assembly pilin Flp